ncbi:hypothetical protein P3T27_004921 [Kitasatospora sp. MAA19]|nr:hypothetical protein [Kitasatospora sp. MAA19]
MPTAPNAVGTPLRRARIATVESRRAIAREVLAVLAVSYLCHHVIG